MWSVSNKSSKLFDERYLLKISDLLEDHLTELYSFYCENIYKFINNTCTILVARRSPVLFSWFFYLSMDKLKKDVQENFEIDVNEQITITNKKTGKKNFIISDRYLYTPMFLDFISQNEDVEFVVLDDICIHGRAMNNITNFIRNRIGNNILKQLSIRRNVYMLSTKSNTHEIENSRILLEYGSWLPLSNALVETINFLNLPYVSYLNSYMYFNAENINEILEKLQHNSLRVIDFSTSKQKTLGQHAYLMVEKNMRCFDEEVFSCLRLYYSEELQSVAVIPFVMLKKLDNNQIIKMINSYIKDKGVLKFCEKDESQSEFLYELLTCIVSNIFGHYCIKKYLNDILSNEYRVDDYCSALQLSFGKALKDIITDISIFRSWDEILSMRSNKNGIVCLKDAPIDNDFNRDTDIGLILTEKWIDDEIHACYLMEKGNHISMEDLIYSEDEHGKKILDLKKIASIFRHCDTGEASILVRSYVNKVGNAIDVGELGANLMHDRKLNNESISIKLEELFNFSDYYKFLLG